MNKTDILPVFYQDDFVLYQGDSLEILPTFPESSFDMIFADPPYMLSNNGFTCQNGKMVSVNKGEWDKSGGFSKDVEFHETWIKHCYNLLKPNGTIWISGTYHSIYQCGFILQKLGFHILNDITWFKPNASPNLSGRMFTASHETLLWARKSAAAKHIFNYESMKEGSFPEDSIKKEGKQMRSLWSIPTTKISEKKHGKHPTQKPLALLERIIKASTNEGDIILDPFNGSGTTGIAAKLNNRKYVGIEFDKTYIDLTIKRYNDIKKELF
ncbi:MAG: site-specific DNA-methyltransferase [Alphaproteobacteria bacterium]|nr:site-specific DNA-methyltransferase [Alphaproteobacteria bacterium]